MVVCCCFVVVLLLFCCCFVVVLLLFVATLSDFGLLFFNWSTHRAEKDAFKNAIGLTSRWKVRFRHTFFSKWSQISSKYRVTKGFKFHARPQTGASSCLNSFWPKLPHDQSYPNSRVELFIYFFFFFFFFKYYFIISFISYLLIFYCIILLFMYSFMHLFTHLFVYITSVLMTLSAV